MESIPKLILIVSLFLENVPDSYGAGVCQCTCSNQGGGGVKNTGRAPEGSDDDDDDDGYVPPPGAQHERVYSSKTETRTDPATAAAIAALIKFAAEQGAPFVEEALKKLKGEIFGTGRAARSTDVGLVNVANANWEMSEQECKRGGWTSQVDLFPPHNVLALTSVVYGGQSHGVFTGVNCFVEYKAAGGKFIRLKFSNPYAGSNYAEATAMGVRVTSVSGGGNNNIVRFTVQDL